MRHEDLGTTIYSGAHRWTAADSKERKEWSQRCPLEGDREAKQPASRDNCELRWTAACVEDKVASAFDVGVKRLTPLVRLLPYLDVGTAWNNDSMHELTNAGQQCAARECCADMSVNDSLGCGEGEGGSLGARGWEVGEMVCVQPRPSSG